MHRSSVLIALSWILALAGALTGPLAAPTPAGAGLAGLVVEDVDDNGRYDAEIDRDVTAVVLDEGSFSTPHSILVARALTSRHPFGISLTAGQNLRVNADLNALARGAGISLLAQDGAITIGERANVTASGYIDVNGAAGIDVAARASLHSRDLGGGLFLTTDGNIAGGDHSRFTAKGGVDMFALSGEIHIGPAQMISGSDYIGITAGGRVWVSGGRLETPTLSIVTFADLVTFSNNAAKFGRDGLAYFSAAADSTVDISKTIFSGLGPDDLIIDADRIVR